MGDGLYLEYAGQTASSWLFRYSVKGKASWLGLGSCKDVTEKQARERVAEARASVRRGEDPAAKKRAQRRADARVQATAARTVETAVRDYWEKKCQHLAKKDVWIRMFEIHVFPTLGAKAVNDLTAEDIVKVLEPIWKGSKDARDVDQGKRPATGYPTAKRLRDRLKLVLTRERMTNANVDPFICDVAKEVLPNVEWEEEPHAAVDWRDVPDLWMKLPNTIAGVGLRALILTGLRVSCVTKASWGEVDLKEGIWTIPKGRVKGWNSGFRIPLTRELRDVLLTARRFTEGADFIFASEQARKKGVISENTWNSWLQENGWQDTDGRAATAHGFRSTFRDWAAKERWPRDLTEHSIQHVSAKGTKVERAYWREDRIEERAELLEAWNAFVVSKGESRWARERHLSQVAEPTSDRTVIDVERWGRREDED